MCKCIFCSQIFSYKKGKKVKMPEIHSYMAINGWAYARMVIFFLIQLISVPLNIRPRISFLSQKSSPHE